MAVVNMHIRQDWKELVDHDEYKTLRTICGRRTTRSNVGIPGITDQPSVLYDSKGRKRRGWCKYCMHKIFYSHVDSHRYPSSEVLGVMTKDVRDIYEKIFAAIDDYEAQHSSG